MRINIFGEISFHKFTYFLKGEADNANVTVLIAATKSFINEYLKDFNKYPKLATCGSNNLQYKQ
jgi:hypothetical protein